MVIDPRRIRELHKSLYMDDTSEDLTWSHNTQQIIKNPTEAALFEKTEEI